VARSECGAGAIRRHLAGLAALALAGCGEQPRNWTAIEVTSSPPGAHCEVIRGNLNLGGFDTPGQIRLDGSRLSAVFVCSREEYRDALFVLRPIPHSLTLKSLVLPMGGVISATSGRDNSYDETVAISLEPRDGRR